VGPLDHQNLVGDLVELLHLAFSQQLSQLLEVLGLFELASYRQFLLVCLGMIPIVVSDVDISTTVSFSLSLCLSSEGLRCHLFWNELIGWLADSVLSPEHVGHCWFRHN
jgi:hypothetical protein